METDGPPRDSSLILRACGVSTYPSKILAKESLRHSLREKKGASRPSLRFQQAGL